MPSVDTLIRQTQDALAHPLTLPHQAASIAMTLFLLSEVHGLTEDPRVRDLGLRFAAAVRAAGLEDVLSNQLRYAIRLASGSGPLLFEDMFKLFSLCNEVHALRALGFAADAQLIADFETSVRARIAAQRADASYAAACHVKPWNRNLWWFKGRRGSTVICFYRVAEDYGCFSNFAPYPIEIDGARWPTSEHYFQAQKFDDAAQQERIRRVASPTIAARMGRSRWHSLRPDWEDVKDAVMRAAVRAKFTQHAEIRDVLLSTGDAEIVEHTRNDAYWGDGGDGSGRNMLGRILMEIRAELRTQTQSPSPLEGEGRGGGQAR